MNDWSRYALFLDFDGTLVDIAPRPDAVVVEPGLVASLETLRRKLDGALAIVTGRPIATIDDFLAPARFDAAGLHGLEIRRGEDIVGGRPEDHPDLRAGIARIKENVAELPGILVEDKGGSVSVHWRLAEEPEAEAAEAIVVAIAAELGERYKLLLGKAVGEILPATATKGAAIRTYCTAAPYAGRTPLFFGDDRTDEIAFATLKEDGGIGVRVGDGDTAARYRLEGPAAVRSLLASWADGADLSPETLPTA